MPDKVVKKPAGGEEFGLNQTKKDRRFSFSENCGGLILSLSVPELKKVSKKAALFIHLFSRKIFVKGLYIPSDIRQPHGRILFPDGSLLRPATVRYAYLRQ